ncbi:Uncharacterised protein [Vibrio cholerae]|nr:Uncharacterised protein [Vibrio cholerae]CSB84174.1 Uncharacterised protein [Vibrio cholerae]
MPYRQARAGFDRSLRCSSQTAFDRFLASQHQSCAHQPYHRATVKRA